MLEFINSPHYNQANFSEPLPSRDDAEQYMQAIHFVDTDASDFDKFRESIEHDEASNIPEIPGRPRVFFYILDPPYFQTKTQDTETMEEMENKHKTESQHFEQSPKSSNVPTLSCIGTLTGTTSDNYSQQEQHS